MRSAWPLDPVAMRGEGRGKGRGVRRSRPEAESRLFQITSLSDNAESLICRAKSIGLLISVHHRLRGRGITVITMTSKVNGKTEISTPCKSKTLKILNNNNNNNTLIYIAPACRITSEALKHSVDKTKFDWMITSSTPTCVNFRGNRFKWVLSPNNWNIA